MSINQTAHGWVVLNHLKYFQPIADFYYKNPNQNMSYFDIQIYGT